MFKNYLIIAWRNFIKHRTFSLINIIGFALAIASCFLILFHIQSELSYEKFYTDYERIYCIHPADWAKSSPPLAEAVADFFPEVRSIGLFGLSAITMESRKKEIGIRKVVGATIPTILRILSREFVAMELIGSLIALPVAWYAMDAWLQKFAFKIQITPDIFVVTVGIALLVAVGSVLINALRAARMNPVESLRSE